jgi:hypothetical protein
VTNFSNALADDLAVLSTGLDDPVIDLAAVLDVLFDELIDAVPSFVGMELITEASGIPIVLVVTRDYPDPSLEAQASLMLPLLSTRGDRDTTKVIYYATEAGGLIDLAEDGQWILNLDGNVELDLHLPALQSEVTGIRGLNELREFNQAVGVLIEDGHSPEAARIAVRRKR